MTDELTNMQIMVIERVTQLSFNTLLASMRALSSVSSKALLQAYHSHQNPHGYQSLKKLNRKNLPLESVKVTDQDLRKVIRDLKKFGVDFAVKRDLSDDTYRLYFKGRDAEQIHHAVRNYVSKIDFEPKAQHTLAEKLTSAREIAQQRNQALNPQVMHQQQRLC